MSKYSIMLLCFRFKEALSDFDSSLKILHGNTAIDYKLLGLSYKLYSCDVS
jgi:hypothetical protein